MLRLKGYKILKMRYKTYCGEIDIIAKHKDILAFVEVKSRKNVDQAIAAVTPRTQFRIKAASNCWMPKMRNGHKFSQRFDIIVVSGRRWPKHFPDAF